MAESLRRVQTRTASRPAEPNSSWADAGQCCKSIKAPVLFRVADSKPAGHEDLGDVLSGVLVYAVERAGVGSELAAGAWMPRKSAAHNWDICS
jgi:hypothetical protein